LFPNLFPHLFPRSSTLILYIPISLCSTVLLLSMWPSSPWNLSKDAPPPPGTQLPTLSSVPLCPPFLPYVHGLINLMRINSCGASFTGLYCYSFNYYSSDSYFILFLIKRGPIGTGTCLWGLYTHTHKTPPNPIYPITLASHSLTLVRCYYVTYYIEKNKIQATGGMIPLPLKRRP
jgi:hypothetical protein